MSEKSNASETIEKVIQQTQNSWTEMARADRNNLSYWFPKVSGCGFKMPKTIIIEVPDYIMRAFFLEEKGDKKKIRDFVKKVVKPATVCMKGRPFIKNGCFSNKFQFNLCCPTDNKIDTLTQSLIGINYDALCFGANGESEIAIRERIPTSVAATIYNGMPLRTEFRVFYDFTFKKLLYIENYWDWMYCHEAIERHPEDGKTFYDNYGRIYKNYYDSVRILKDKASELLAKVTDLDGIWSVDFLLDDENEFWLIDMAEGNRSAYYDEYRCLMPFVYPKMEEFFFRTGYDPAGQKTRKTQYHDWTVSLNRTFGDEIIEMFMDAYGKIEKLGPARFPESVLDGKYDPFLAFLIKNHPRKYEGRMESALFHYRNGFRKDAEEKDKVFHRQAWEGVAKPLFAISVMNFIKPTSK